MSRSLVSFRLADDLKQALNERASTEGISNTELINRLLRQSLSCDRVGFSTESRLSDLEQAVKQIVKKLDFERHIHGVIAQPNQDMERRLMEVEEKLQQISADVEERRRRLGSLVRDKRQAKDDGQDTHHNRYSDDFVEVSLEDLRSLLRPTLKLTEVE